MKPRIIKIFVIIYVGVTKAYLLKTLQNINNDIRTKLARREENGKVV